MIYITNYKSPIGNILLAAKDEKLIGLWIEGQTNYLDSLQEKIKKEDCDILRQTKNWLERYFHLEQPRIEELSLNPVGSDFRKKVWKVLTEIPYGCVTTYGNIAKRLAKESGMKRMSAQAVGGAVGHNPISIIIPCHRVIGSSGELTGYNGGIHLKKQLLMLENFDLNSWKKERYNGREKKM